MDTAEKIATLESAAAIMGQVGTWDSHTCAVELRQAAASLRRLVDDERAAVQRRIADAICAVDAKATAYWSQCIIADPLAHDMVASIAALAAAARDDVIADALAQVRQAIMLERGR